MKLWSEIDVEQYVRKELEIPMEIGLLWIRSYMADNLDQVGCYAQCFAMKFEGKGGEKYVHIHIGRGPETPEGFPDIRFRFIGAGLKQLPQYSV